MHQPLRQKHRGAVANQAIPFHLAKTEAAISRPTLSWLPCEQRSGSTRTRVHLVHHHVLQLLVVDRPKEDVPNTDAVTSSMQRTSVSTDWIVEATCCRLEMALMGCFMPHIVWMKEHRHQYEVRREMGGGGDRVVARTPSMPRQ